MLSKKTLQSLFDHFRASEVRGWFLLHPCLKKPLFFGTGILDPAPIWPLELIKISSFPQVLQGFGQFGVPKTHPKCQKCQVFLRVYKVLAHLCFLCFSRNVGFTKVFKGLWVCWTQNLVPIWPEIWLLPRVFIVSGLILCHFGSFRAHLGPAVPQKTRDVFAKFRGSQDLGLRSKGWGC